MAPPRRAPGPTELRAYIEKGLTQQQVVEAWERDSGERVARSTIAIAIVRYGLQSAHPRPTYPDLLPWKLAPKHRQHIDARMLRLEGRRRAGRKLSPWEQRWLSQWKADLNRKRAVVHYERDTDDGFWWIPREPRHGDSLINWPT